MNKDDPALLDFNELAEVNSRMLINLRVLQYLFLPRSNSPSALSDITKYLEYKGKEVQFHFDSMFLIGERFVLMVHVLLLLNKLLIDPTKIDVSATDTCIEFKAVSRAPINGNRLKAFDHLVSTPLKDISLSDDAKSHVYYIKEILKDLVLGIDTIASEQEFVLSIGPLDKAPFA
ncbi:hypothetical protein NHE_0672 [Neorickettsia helminthoeca str. Oregon]|uniref:Histidine phosphotransferase ChpT C-terminal domain-containing protein n=2 Tax=Neorickettsia helminthoeca TaxID=33994 RepID=X5HMC2_9RICK|nr:hypothetical protein NHE_0672 [Neorickettsia helminthoeca str. Oregon]